MRYWRSSARPLTLSICSLAMILTTSHTALSQTASTSGNGAHKWAVVVHGGAGVIEHSSMTPEAEAKYRAGINEAIQAAAAVLDKGGSSLDAIEAAIKLLEDNPMFNAGRGAVADVQRTRHPISLARAVMEQSPHVMLVGAGADDFAANVHLEQVPPSFF